jgi:predicted component of type VI protein secretion system
MKVSKYDFEILNYVETSEPDRVADYITELLEKLVEKDQQIVDLEGHIKGLTKVRNYEKCKHIRKRKRLQQQIAELEAKLAEKEVEIDKGE